MSLGTDMNYKNMLNTLRCSICTILMKPPVYLCNTGQSSCSSCQSKNKTNIIARNHLAEEIMELLFYPCENNGCEEMHRLKDMTKHQAICQYKIYNCPDFDVCNKRDNIRNLIEHIKTEHVVFSDNQNNATFKFANLNLMNNVFITCFKKLFIFHLKIVNDNMKISVNEITINFEPKLYTLKFTSENSTSATFTNECQHFANEEDNSLIIPFNLIKFAKINEETYRIELKIHNKP